LTGNVFPVMPQIEEFIAMHLRRSAWPAIISVFVACSSTSEGPGPGPEGDVAGNDGPGATETNVVPVQCTTDDDCPPNMTCAPFAEGDPVGACTSDAGAPDGSASR